MADELDDTIRENARGPAKAATPVTLTSTGPGSGMPRGPVATGLGCGGWWPAPGFRVFGV